MGNQATSGASAKPDKEARNYFSVEYLNGNHGDLDFSKLEKFTNKNYLASINTGDARNCKDIVELKSPGMEAQFDRAG
jgi:hypothetical protein